MSYCRRSSLSCVVSAFSLRCWLSESCCRRSSLSSVDNASCLAVSLRLRPLQRNSLPSAVSEARRCLRRSLSLSLRLLQRISLSSAVSDARCSLSRSLLWRNLSSDRCHVRCDSRSVIGERGRSSFSMVVNDSGAILTMKKKLQVLP